ncbi:MAG TPA: hypothetical protein DDW91_15960 [Shewanella frigidimarina]|nr:hypothetical protein [Shewanella frigidimarina]
MPSHRKELTGRERRQDARSKADRMRTGGTLVAGTGVALKTLATLLVKNHPVGRVFTGLSLLTQGVKLLANREANEIDKAANGDAENQIQQLQVSAPKPRQSPPQREPIDIDHQTGRVRMGPHEGRIDTRPVRTRPQRDPLEPPTAIA